MKFKLLFVVLILLFSCDQEKKSNLTIATAANMKFAMQELVKEFHQKTGINSEVIVGSSGKLTAQIKEGAPYDLFVSADMKFPNTLFENGLTLGKPQIYAYGSLVIWTVNTQLKADYKSFFKKQVNHVALANPKTAPYGRAAMEVLKKKGLFESLKSKFVYGESIAQTNQFIISYAAEIGFTTISIVLSPNMKGKGNWKDVDHKLYTPIEQGLVILKNRDVHLKEAKRFQEFLFSSKGKEILNKFGYLIKG
jgi:molybdate transport system substrate-binding protein